jgi:hypothetical protein
LTSVLVLFNQYVNSVNNGKNNIYENHESSISQWVPYNHSAYRNCKKMRYKERRLCKVVNLGRQFIIGPKVRGWTFLTIEELRPIFKREHINQLESDIKKQTDILIYKLKNETNSILVDCAVTDYLLSVIRLTNKITSFKYWLDLEDTKKGDVD